MISLLKKKQCQYGFIACVVLLSSCQFSDSRRFSGFETKIDIQKIIEAKPTGKVETIDVPNADSLTMDYNKVLSDIRYIPLETTPDSKFGEITNIYFSTDRIIVVDKGVTGSVFIYDSGGHFLNKIDPKDKLKDKNAATHFFSAIYFPNKEEIILHDDKKDSLYFYDKNGHYRHRERTFISFSDFSAIGQSDNLVYLSLYGGNDHLSLDNKTDLYIGKTDSRITNIAPNATQKVKIKNKYYYDRNLSQGGEKVFYTPVFSDTTYEINAITLSADPRFKLTFPAKTLNKKIAENPDISVDDLVELRNSHEYYSFRGEVLAGNDDIYYFNCTKKGQLGLFYSKKSGKIIGGELTTRRAFTDSTYVEDYQYPIASSKGKFISLLDPASFTAPSNSVLSKAYATAIRGFTKKSNPILVMYKVKPF